MKQSIKLIKQTRNSGAEYDPDRVDLSTQFRESFHNILRRSPTWGYVGAGALAGDHHVGGVGRVESLAGAVVHQDVGLPERVGRHPDVLDVVVLGGVPAHVGVGPLLRRHSK